MCIKISCGIFKKIFLAPIQIFGTGSRACAFKKSSIGECDVQAGSRIVAKDIISTVTERCEVKRGWGFSNIWPNWVLHRSREILESHEPGAWEFRVWIQPIYLSALKMLPCQPWRLEATFVFCIRIFLDWSWTNYLTFISPCVLIW